MWRAIWKQINGRSFILPRLLESLPVISMRNVRNSNLGPCLSRPNFGEERSSGVLKVSVLTYNVLADIYAHDGQYSHLQKWSLEWENRRERFLDEINDYKADILCLQEVLNTDFENFFAPELELLGYSGIYKKKSGDRAFDSSTLRVVEELQSIIREDRDEAFQKLKQCESDSSLRRVLQGIEALEALEPEERDEALQRLKKDNVAIVVVLEKLGNEDSCKGIPPRICVANTHIYPDERFEDVKFFQVVDLINGLEKISDAKIPLLVCGDFNSVPLSAPYEFINTGKVLNLPYTDPYSICRHLKLDHPLALKSSYASFYNSDYHNKEQSRKFCPKSGEPKFTHLSTRFCGTLDYIFYTEESLILDGVLELVEESELGLGIPCSLYPSDHIAIMARFILDPAVLQQASFADLPEDLW